MRVPIRSRSGPNVVAAIPARNEAREIGGCLHALARQQGARLDAAVVCVNNSDDGTAGVIGAAAARLPFAVHVIEVALPPARAYAGAARRIAMDRAAELAGAHGRIVTTDADGRACPDWLATNLAAIAAGAEAVAGRAEIEPEGAKLIPAHLHAADAAECAYAALLDEITALLDPDLADPWPRHDQHSGASIAVTVGAYRRAGGMPAVPLAEDRAFFEALRRVDARIRHAPEPCVIVSARIVGRAPGGMADTIRRRMAAMDAFVDDRLEPARDAARRAWVRGRVRAAWMRQPLYPGVAASGGLSGKDLAEALREQWFGAAWATLQQRSAWMYKRAAMPVADLPRETRYAAAILDRLRSGQAEISPATGPAGMPLPAAAAPA